VLVQESPRKGQGAGGQVTEGARKKKRRSKPLIALILATLHKPAKFRGTGQEGGSRSERRGDPRKNSGGGGVTENKDWGEGGQAGQ